MSVEAECAGHDTVECGVQIGVGLDDDRVLAAHLEDGALDEDLTGLGFGGTLMDLQTDGLRTGKCDETCLRMGDNSAPEVGALARAQVDDAVRQANLFEQFHKLRGNRRGVDRRLQDDGVAADDRGRGHSGHDREGEVPRWNHGTNAERDIAQLVAFARKLNRRSGSVQAKRLAAVELQKVDGLAYVGVGLAPVFADLECQPCAELEAAFANQCSGAEQEICTVGDGSPAPGRESGLRGLHRRFDVLCACALVNADHLRRMCGVHGEDLAGGL